MRPDFMKYLASLVASTMLLLLVVVLPATATDLAIGYLTASCDGPSGTLDWIVTTDREGLEATHELVRVEWAPEGSGAWQKIGEGQLSEENGFAYDAKATGLDFAGLTRVDVRATAVAKADGGDNWGDGRRAGDVYTSAVPVEVCTNEDPAENARVNWSGGCRTTSAIDTPSVMLFNDGEAGVDADLEFVIEAQMDGVDMESRTQTVSAGNKRRIELTFSDANGPISPEDKTISVVVSVGDRTEFKHTFKVDCAAPPVEPQPEPTASMFGDCNSNGSQVVVNFSNPTATPVTYVVTIDGVEVFNAGVTGDQREGFDVADNGTYAVVVTADGVELLNRDITVNCFETEANPTASIDGACSDINPTDGLIVVSAGNDSLTSTNFVVTIDGVEVDSFDLANDSEIREYTVTGDGTYAVVVTADGNNVLGTDITIDCVPDLANPTASINGSCTFDNNGVITVSAGNDTLVSSNFVVTIDGVEVDSFDLANDSEIREYAVSGNGTYVVVVTADGVEVASESVDIDCLEPAVPTASILGDCDVTGGVLTVTLNNAGEEAATYVVSIDGDVQDTVVLGAGSQTLTYDVPDGTYDVVVTADGVEIASETIELDCSSVAGVVYEVVCGPDNTLMITASNPSTSPSAIVVTVDGVEYDLGMVAPGAEAVVNAPVEDGPVHVVVTDDGEVAVDTIFNVSCAASPLASINGACTDDGGLITVELSNLDSISTTFVVTINGAVVDTITITDAATTRSYPFLDEGTYDVVVTADGVEVASESIVIDCLTPASPSASIFGDCETTDGVLNVTLDNTGDEAATFVVTIDGVIVDTVELANDSTTLEFDVEDGVYDVEVLVDGVAIASETLFLDCSSSVAGVSYEIICGSVGGTLEVTVTNPGSEPSAIVVTVGDDVYDLGMVAAGAEVLVEAPVEDGEVDLIVTNDGVVVAEVTLNVDCVEEPLEVVIDVECDETGNVVVTIDNNDQTDREVVLSVDGVEQVVIIPAGGSTTTTVEAEDGDVRVLVTEDGNVLADETVKVNCDEVLGVVQERPPLANTGSSADLLIPMSFAMMMFGFAMVSIARRRRML